MILTAMAKTDDELDAESRRLLNEVDDLKKLEHAKRRSARSSPEFHALAKDVEAKARQVFAISEQQRNDGKDESPMPNEREEQHPGDWTENGRN